MQGQGKIERVICPYCGKEMIRKLRTLDGTSLFIGKNSYSSIDFRCSTCVYIFRASWFDTFKQYGNLVFRGKEDKELWFNNFKKNSEGLDEWKERVEII